jgi:hypothetical protein
MFVASGVHDYAKGCHWPAPKASQNELSSKWVERGLHFLGFENSGSTFQQSFGSTSWRACRPFAQSVDEQAIMEP